MNSTNNAKKRNGVTKKKVEDSLGSIFHYVNDMKKLAEEYPLLPEELREEHKTLVEKGLEIFDAERSLKKEVSTKSL